MAEPDKEHPSLELPKLRLRRRSAPRQQAAAATPEEQAAVGQVAPEPVVVEPVVVEPVPAPVDAVPTPPGPTGTALLEPEPTAPTSARRARREWHPPGMAAAVVSGAVVGLGTVGLTWAALRSCEGVLGTSSCGGVGYPLLGLILVVMVLVGALLLRLAKVTDPGTTSFLGVGLAVVVALLVLVDHLLDPSMVVVLPVISAATFALAHWMTRTFIEPARD